MDISVTNQIGNMLTISMINREMMHLMRPFLLGRKIDYVPGETKIGLQTGPLLTHRHVDVRIEAKALQSSLEEISGNVLLPCARALGTNLVSSNIASTYELQLPSGYNASRHTFEGVSMRAIMAPLRYDPMADYLVPDKDCKSPDMFELRFDVLFSDQPASNGIDFGNEVKAAQHNAMWDALVAAARAA